MKNLTYENFDSETFENIIRNNKKLNEICFGYALDDAYYRVDDIVHKFTTADYSIDQSCFDSYFKARPGVRRSEYLGEIADVNEDYGILEPKNRELLTKLIDRAEVLEYEDLNDDNYDRLEAWLDEKIEIINRDICDQLVGEYDYCVDMMYDAAYELDWLSSYYIDERGNIFCETPALIVDGKAFSKIA